MAKIWLDPGHGGSDSGAVGNGMYEKTINLTVSMEVKRLLEASGVTVGMSRTSDVYVDLTERCNMANRWGADYFISIHHNAGGGTGYEAIHSVSEGKGKLLAIKVAEEFRGIGQVPHGVGTYSKKGSNGDYYAVIRQTNMSAIITEFGFIDTADAQKFNTDEKLRAEARAIASAIARQLGIGINNAQTASKTQEAPQTTSTSSGRKYGVVTASVLNVRKGRSTSYAIIGQLTQGTKIRLDQKMGDWWSIYYGSNGGFVSAQYIQEI